MFFAKLKNHFELMTDPKVEIVVTIYGIYYPFSYRQDGLEIHKYSVYFENETGDIKGFYPNL